MADSHTEFKVDYGNKRGLGVVYSKSWVIGMVGKLVLGIVTAGT